MLKTYLLGGENVLRRSSKEINEKAFQDAGGAPEVLVFPWARPSFDKKYGKRKLLNDYLVSLGARSVEFIDYSESNEMIAQKMSASDVIYLTGGQATILIERLKTQGVDQLLKRFDGVIIGRSAGALALCNRCITTLRSNGKARIIAGLGLVELILKVHYIQKDDDVLKHFSLNQSIFAIPEKSALVCMNGELSTVGEVYLFLDGKRQLYQSTIG